LAVGQGSFIANHSPLIAQIYLIAEDDKREGFRVARRRLDQELVAPGVEGVEGFRRVDVVDKDATVRSAIEGYAEGLETFLSGCVPKLERKVSQVDIEDETTVCEPA
jgi:hypothetical protein